MKHLSQSALSFAFLLLLISCKKEQTEPKATLNQQEVVLQYNQTFDFEVKKGSSIVDFSTLATSSSDEFVGKTNNQGQFIANTIGETTIKILGEGINLTAKVTVNPIQQLFAEPVTNFTYDKMQIKSAEKRILLQETATGLVYNGENNNLEDVIYLFTPQGKLSAAALLFPSTSSLVEKTAVFYAERYNMIGSSENYYYFENPKLQYIVGIGVDADLGFHALYFKPEDTNAWNIQKAIEPMQLKTRKPVNKDLMLKYHELKKN